MPSADKQQGNSKKVVGRPFKKGQSGNLKGRPPKVRTIPDILRKIGEEDGLKDGSKTKLDVVMSRVYGYALDGKSWAVQFIADRTEGKAVETVRNQTIKDELIIE